MTNRPPACRIESAKLAQYQTDPVPTPPASTSAFVNPSSRRPVHLRSRSRRSCGSGSTGAWRGFPPAGHRRPGRRGAVSRPTSEACWVWVALRDSTGALRCPVESAHDERLVRQLLRRAAGTAKEETAGALFGMLAEKGLIRRIQPAGSPALYEGRVGDNHHQVICRIAEEQPMSIDCAVGEARCLTAVDDSGYQIDEADVIYWGTCSECLSATRFGRRIDTNKSPRRNQTK
jgi:Fe2+ or Zn2+ uptake regulation protein